MEDLRFVFMLYVSRTGKRSGAYRIKTVIVMENYWNCIITLECKIVKTVQRYLRDVIVVFNSVMQRWCKRDNSLFWPK